MLGCTVHPSDANGKVPAQSPTSRIGISDTWSDTCTDTTQTRCEKVWPDSLRISHSGLIVPPVSAVGTELCTLLMTTIVKVRYLAAQPAREDDENSEPVSGCEGRRSCASEAL